MLRTNVETAIEYRLDTAPSFAEPSNPGLGDKAGGGDTKKYIHTLGSWARDYQGDYPAHDCQRISPQVLKPCKIHHAKLELKTERSDLLVRNLTFEFV